MDIPIGNSSVSKGVFSVAPSAGDIGACIFLNLFHEPGQCCLCLAHPILIDGCFEMCTRAPQPSQVQAGYPSGTAPGQICLEESRGSNSPLHVTHLMTALVVNGVDVGSRVVN